MAPPRTLMKTPRKTPLKKNRKVMSLADKLKILNSLRDGDKVAAIARRFEVNESTIRTIRDSEAKIRESAQILGQHAQAAKVVRHNFIEKAEEMLMIWIQDFIHKKIPLSTAAIRDQAIVFHTHLCEKYNKTEKFNASKGWFERFKARFMLHNVKFSGESSSADHEAARVFPAQVREVIAEKHFVPDQIFNCDETGLFWKRMPSRTWLTKEELRAPGFKVAKDRFTLLFCVNATGNLKCKPMLVYRSENPRALKGKNKEQLPVHWTSNKTAWVTRNNFENWFLHSFIPEVKEFLAKKNLAFKVLLLLDNYKSHDGCLQTAHPDVEVMFLPPNTTSLIQPLDQTVIATFKSYYLRRVIKSLVQKVNLHRTCDNFVPDNVVRQYWKMFSIMDAINFVEEAWTEVKLTTVNQSWKKLLPEVVAASDAEQQSNYQDTVREVIALAREVEGEGFQDLEESEVLDLVEERTDLTPEEIEVLSNNPPEEETEEGLTRTTSETIFDAKAVVEIINLINMASEQAVQKDPIMVRSLNFKRQCDLTILIYDELYRDILRRAKQAKLTDYFQNK
ncbi:tigger transposable element-derived protein 1-like [Phymastichus coffea]|uniref:tigger transposable element-derived protein 1-like n=1 Tax=Phymastichus coffea TaxID=108790 RepID=UPI00273B21B0|nr:tigger transposable element-derived protein 1-like [Phymastichus coffea]